VGRAEGRNSKEERFRSLVIRIGGPPQKQQEYLNDGPIIKGREKNVEGEGRLRKANDRVNPGVAPLKKVSKRNRGGGGGGGGVWGGGRGEDEVRKKERGVDRALTFAT